MTSGSLLHVREFDVALATQAVDMALATLAVDVVLGRGVVSGVMEIVKMTKMGHEFHRGPFS